MHCVMIDITDSLGNFYVDSLHKYMYVCRNNNVVRKFIKINSEMYSASFIGSINWFTHIYIGGYFTNMG